MSQQKQAPQNLHTWSAGIQRLRSLGAHESRVRFMSVCYSISKESVSYAGLWRHTYNRFLFVSQDKSFEKSVFWASLFLFFKNFGFVCMCVCVCQHHYGGRRTTFGSQFSTSTMWVLGDELRLSGLVACALTTEQSCQPLFVLFVVVVDLFLIFAILMFVVVPLWSFT